MSHPHRITSRQAKSQVARPAVCAIAGLRRHHALRLRRQSVKAGFQQARRLLPDDAVGPVVGASRADEYTEVVSEVSVARCLGEAAGGRRRAERRQALPRRRSISLAGTPQICATWATFMPYFTQVRMRATCERGISTIGGAGATGLSGSSCRADAGLIGSTRGLRADGSVGAVCWAAGVLTGGFDVNRASAAWRARVIRSRSSPRGCGCCCRLSKTCSEWLNSFAIIEETIREFWQAGLGKPGRYPQADPQPRCKITGSTRASIRSRLRHP